MKTANQIIDLFMQAKNNKLDKLLGCPSGYYTIPDEEEMLGWPEEDAINILERLIVVNSCGLEEANCPWCIFMGDSLADPCSECGYGKRHGICTHTLYPDKQGNTWGKIIDECKKKQIDLYGIFNSDYYNTILAQAKSELEKPKEDWEAENEI